MSRSRGLTTRVLLLSSVLSAFYTVVNTYLNVNFGMGFGYTTITLSLIHISEPTRPY